MMMIIFFVMLIRIIIVVVIIMIVIIHFSHLEYPPFHLNTVEQVNDSQEGSSLDWASKLLGVKPDQLEDALVARLISPGGFGSGDLVVVPSSPTVRAFVNRPSSRKPSNPSRLSDLPKKNVRLES